VGSMSNAKKRKTRSGHPERLAGAWGPFKVTIPCGGCSLTLDVITDTFETELAGVPVALDVREWPTEWWKPLRKGGWHAPIVMVEGRVVSQGHALNRGVLTEAIIDNLWATICWARLPVPIACAPRDI